MNINGLGMDIIEVERIKKALDRFNENMMNKIFTIEEQKYCLKHKKKPYSHFAGRFAAKEAIAKSLSTGIGKSLSWLDMEILNDEKGKPFVKFSEQAKEIFKNPNILLSISHTDNYASAVAILL